MTPSQSRALDDLWPAFGIDETGPLSFDALFGRAVPVVIEIGFGDGESLIAQAANDPDRNYLGIEVHEPGIGHCLLRIEQQDLENVRLISGDAAEVLGQQVRDGALSRLNLYFPDPWPKKRHHKRRLIQPTFLALVASKLAHDGALHIATDWAGYAEHIDEVIRLADCLSIAERIEHDGSSAIDRPMTKFERRGLGKGHRIWDWRLTKPS